MHAALLTVLIVSGGGYPASATADQTAMAPATDPYTNGGQDCGCATGAASGTDYSHRGCLKDWMGPMPQTCYAPRYGCYSGNERHMNRYPAFHGNYYRNPYNYRTLFDYPWHAAPHEPMGFFLYEAEQMGEETLTPTPAAGGMPLGPGHLQSAPLPPADRGQARLDRYEEPRRLSR